LINQLYISGSLVSLNTVFGADPPANSSRQLPSASLNPNSISSLPPSRDLAAVYDLNHAREYTLCWRAVSELSSGIPNASPSLEANAYDYDGSGNVSSFRVSDGDPSGPDVNYPLDDGDVYPCPNALRSSTLQARENPANGDGYNDYNQPLYIEYIPPPSTLPVIGGAQGQGFTLF